MERPAPLPVLSSGTLGQYLIEFPVRIQLQACLIKYENHGRASEPESYQLQFQNMSRPIKIRTGLFTAT